MDIADLTGETKSRLLALVGVGTELHSRHRLYIEIVTACPGDVVATFEADFADEVWNDECQ